MKVGILTFHSVPNFGANLQAYATYCALMELNCEVKIIDYFPEHFENQKFELQCQSQFQAHRDFIIRNTTLTERCRNDKELVATCIQESFDHILIGSDAVFLVNNKHPFWKYPNPFWANWIFSNQELKDTKVSTLSASSMGTLFYFLNSEIKQSIKENLKKFYSITVRDSWTKKSFERLTKIESRLISAQILLPLLKLGIFY
ncbi:MAG: polysaccharide pyruvyl transferase family protein [Cyclobacteriaceae bacterium]|nr:polysaccharide pyruvyl transferase family protein [Cyclobacteriaceae bacterium]